MLMDVSKIMRKGIVETRAEFEERRSNLKAVFIEILRITCNVRRVPTPEVIFTDTEMDDLVAMDNDQFEAAIKAKLSSMGLL